MARPAEKEREFVDGVCAGLVAAAPSGAGSGRFRTESVLPEQLLREVQRLHPARADSSLGPVLQGLTDYAPGGVVAPVGRPLHRVGRGPYRLTEHLTRILARDGAQTSATSTQRQLHDPAGRLADEADRYLDSLTVATAKAFSHADHDPGRADEPGSGRPAPLPWLPPIPAALATHPVWGSYLSDQAQQVHDLARQTADLARAWSASTAPTWAAPLLAAAPDDRQLVTRLAVWRAGHRVPHDDVRPTGPPSADPTTSAAATQRALEAGVHRLLPAGTGSTPRYAMLTALEPRLLSDPGYPHLLTRLDALPGAVDVRALAAQALGRGPLPDELPAAALWWRLTRALPAEPERPPTPPAPVTAADRWRPLAEAVDPRLTGCPAWRGLAAALDRADQAGYDVTAHLPRLAAQAPLPEDHPSRALHYRLVDECPAATTPPPTPRPSFDPGLVPGRQVEPRRPVAPRRGPAL